MLESSKDRMLGVGTPGQHVPPRVRYGTTCLLIRTAIGCVSYSVEWGMTSYFVNRLNHMAQEGTFVRETLALQAGTVCLETVAKYNILL
jgi:hypothetical protein